MNKPFTKEEIKSLPDNWFTPSGTEPNRKQRRSMNRSIRKSQFNKNVTRWQFERNKNGRAKWIAHFDVNFRAMTSLLSTQLTTAPTSEPQE